MFAINKSKRLGVTHNVTNALVLREPGPLLFQKPSPWTSRLCIYISALAAPQISRYSCHLVWTVLACKLPSFPLGLYWLPHSVLS